MCIPVTVLLRTPQLVSRYFVMDPATPPPSTRRVINLPISPPKRRKRLDLGHLTVVEKQCMVNMYKQIVDEDPTARTVAIVSKISKGTGKMFCL